MTKLKVPYNLEMHGPGPRANEAVVKLLEKNTTKPLITIKSLSTIHKLFKDRDWYKKLG